MPLLVLLQINPLLLAKPMESDNNFRALGSRVFVLLERETRQRMDGCINQAVPHRFRAGIRSPSVYQIQQWGGYAIYRIMKDYVRTPLLVFEELTFGGWGDKKQASPTDWTGIQKTLTHLDNASSYFLRCGPTNASCAFPDVTLLYHHQL